MQLKDLKPNKRNPRKISEGKLNALRKSLEKFGDLSGFVWNRRFKRLVGGHQRSKSLPPDSKIVIEVKYDKPTAACTVAEGYVLVGGERFKYREVDADELWETEALLAANKHGGDWDEGLLKIVMADFPNLNLELAGFEIPAPQVNVPAPAVELPSRASGHDEDEDAKYARETPETTEQIPTGNGVNQGSGSAFDAVEEKKMDVVGRRYVIIIDCASDEAKKALKEKLQPLVIEAGAKFF